MVRRLLDLPYNCSTWLRRNAPLESSIGMAGSLRLRPSSQPTEEWSPWRHSRPPTTCFSETREKWPLSKTSQSRYGRHEVIPLHADIQVQCRRQGFEGLATVFWHKISNATTEVGGPGATLGKPYEPNGVVKNDVEYVLRFKKTGPYRKSTPLQRAGSFMPPAQTSARAFRRFDSAGQRNCDIRGFECPSAEVARDIASCHVQAAGCFRGIVP